LLVSSFTSSNPDEDESDIESLSLDTYYKNTPKGVLKMYTGMQEVRTAIIESEECFLMSSVKREEVLV
jgi:hypothetical protein